MPANDIKPLKNNELKDFMTPFTGEWKPSIDPTLIGAENYQVLTNMRYKKDGSGLEGINGYYDFNSTGITTYVNINTGIHFRTNRTNDSYILVHASDSSGNGKIYYSTSTVGGSEGSGSFNGTAIHTDNSANLKPRFSRGPAGIIAYSNGEESKIWGGTEINIASVYTLESSASASDPGYFQDADTNGWAFPVDVTDDVINKLTNEYFTFDTSDRNAFLVFSTRMLKGIKVYIPSGYENSNSANTEAIDVEVWNGSAFVAVSSLSDGTAKMTQTGTLSFTSTVGTAKLKHYEEKYLYVYFVRMTATSGTSSCRIYQITLDAPMQNISNVWDGIYRHPIQVQRYINTSESYSDYTLHVFEQSTVDLPVGLYVGQLSTSQHIILMFEEQLSAIKFIMLGSLINSADAQLNTTSGVQYWDGNSYANLSFTDQTLDATGDSSFAKTGLVFWNPPSDEQKTTLFGTVGYAYKLTVDATLSGSAVDDVVVDLLYGIPARKNIKVYDFPSTYKNKLMLCSYSEGNEGNRIDFSIDNAPDVFNGDDSSKDGSQSIYVGSTEKITSAIQLYNRFGSNIYTVFIITKTAETWLMIGDGPSDYRLYPISFNIGCPAYDTLTTAEVGFSIGEDVERNVAMWISHQGPVMFDGAVINPIPGLEKYFDPNDSSSVNFSYLYLSKSWFDSTYQEWNLLLPTGNSTTLNTWLVFNIRLRKWFKKDVGVNQDILCGIPALATTGRRYVYGGSDDGKLYQLESGTSWDGSSITYTITTGDFFPSNNPWDITTLRYLKLVTKRIAGDPSSIKISFLKNSEVDISGYFTFYDITTNDTDSGTAGFTFYDVGTSDTDSGTAGYSWIDTDNLSNITVAIGAGLNRLIRDTSSINQKAWCHAVNFIFESNTAEKGFEPIMWGHEYYVDRKDF